MCNVYIAFDAMCRPTLKNINRLAFLSKISFYKEFNFYAFKIILYEKGDRRQSIAGRSFQTVENQSLGNYD